MMNGLSRVLVLENVQSIQAPQQVVWDVTVDVERWPEWTPTVTSAKRLDDGPFRCGSSALLRQPGLPQAKWVVSAMSPGERFTWESQVLGMQMVGTHELSATDSGTQSRLRIEISGIVARLLSPLIRLSVRNSLERENKGLKARCESLVR